MHIITNEKNSEERKVLERRGQLYIRFTLINHLNYSLSQSFNFVFNTYNIPSVPSDKSADLVP